MNRFLEDVSNHKSSCLWLVALVVAAGAVGTALPNAFGYAARAVPALAPFLAAEGSEVGIGSFYIPAAMIAVTSACVALESVLLGYEQSTLKRIVLGDSASVRTDVFYLLLRVSGLMMVLSLLFSLGGLYYASGFIRSHLEDVAVLGARPEAAMLWLGVNAVYQSMVHSHLDWKWRWLEYVLITPAAHRIHHSTAPEHFNSNLGILSIWDRLFGTYIAPEPGQALEFGVPEREHFNTGHYLGEIFDCLWRWAGLKRGEESRAA